MSRSALLAGRTLADVATNLVSLVVMIVVGTVAGFRFDNGLAEIPAGIALVLLFGYAFSEVFAFLGLSASSPEAARSLGFIAIFPLAFASSAFVPVESMPAVVEAMARVNPFTIVVNAVRALFLRRPRRRRRVGRPGVVAGPDRGLRPPVGVPVPPGRHHPSARGRHMEAGAAPYTGR